MKKPTPNSAELHIYSEIDGSGFYGISDREVVQALKELEGEIEELHVRINSGGGDVFAGIAIYEAIRRFPAKTTVHVDGLAASAASVIALAGDEREISVAGIVMVHPASGGVMGQADDMRSMADVLDKITDRIAAIYEDRTTLDKETALELMRAKNGDGTWMNADEAIEQGFIHSIASNEREEMTNQALLERIQNAQRAFGASLTRAAVDVPDREEASPEQTKPTAIAAKTPNKPKKESPMISREALLRERLENLTTAMEQIQNAADERSEDLSTADVAEINDKQAELNDVNAQLDAVLAVKNAKEALNGKQERKGQEPTAQRPAFSSAQANTTQAYNPLRGNGKFTNGLAEFSKAVMENTMRGVPDQRLDAIRNAETSFGTGGEGPGGGYAIPDDFRREIYTNAIEQDPLLSRAREIPTSGRSVTLSTRETQPWQSGNVQANTTAEGAAITRTLYAQSQVKVELHKTAALVFASEELLEDAPALANEIQTVGSEQINFFLTNQMFRGTGVNEMLGLLSSPALVTVAKETAGGAQTADTITVENINNLYAAMPARNRNNAVWVVAPNAEPQIWKAAFHSPSGADPIGRAPGTMPNSPFGTLYGRPVIPHEVCNELGNLGDIFFLDLSDYVMPMKQGGIQTATSMHFAFDQQLQAFRMTIRAGGAPLWKAPIASRDGSFKRSPFVTLAERG